jgi:hypothetical protein
MLKSFITWLDEYLASEGSPALVKAIVGIMGFAALSGAILGGTAVRTGALVAVILVMLAALLLVFADRRNLKQDSDLYRGLLNQYCEFLADREDPVVHVNNWEQITTIESNGDIREIIRLHAEVTTDKLFFLSFRSGPGWKQPTKYRKKVRVAVRGLSGEGVRGTSWTWTHSWNAESKLYVVCHLDAPVPLGSKIHLEMERQWPGKCLPLIRGKRDKFCFNFSKPTDQARYVVVLPESKDAYYDPIGFTEPNTRFSITQDRSPDGRAQFTFDAADMPLGRQVGMRLELK